MKFESVEVVPDNFSGIAQTEGCYVFYSNGKWHRIGGPALMSVNDPTDPGRFYIDDISYSIEKYNKHPLVLQWKLKSILAIDWL